MIPQLPADMHYQFARELTQTRRQERAQQDSRVMVFLRFVSRQIRALASRSADTKTVSAPTSLKQNTASVQ